MIIFVVNLLPTFLVGQATSEGKAPCLVSPTIPQAKPSQKLPRPLSLISRIQPPGSGEILPKREISLFFPIEDSPGIKNVVLPMTFISPHVSSMRVQLELAGLFRSEKTHSEGERENSLMRVVNMHMWCSKCFLSGSGPGLCPLTLASDTFEI